MLIVAKDGTGDFTTIQAAVDAVSTVERAPQIILILSGEYRERVVVDRDNVRIIGENAADTVVTWSACAHDLDAEGKEKGTFLSFTFLVTGRNVTVENLTVRNDAGDGRIAGQAVAVYAAGDRGIWRNCRLIAHQDTLFCGPVMQKIGAEIAPHSLADAECVESVGDCPLTHSRQYFENCLIQGDVDFIFGPYRCWFEGCELRMNARGGWYTAANTPEAQPYGMVFRRCHLTGECEPGKAYLGRPWRKYARTLFLTCEMDACVASCGFIDWDENRVITARCGEWRSVGAGACDARHPAQRLLSDEEARCVTVREVIGGYDGWQPDQSCATWYLCGDSTMADYPAERAPMMGWGQKLQPLLPENAFVENLAVCGRSSKSFIDEGRLDAIAPCLRPGDKLVVSFSHNDEKADPLRHTEPDSTFPETLARYIELALQKGAEPILATPIARRLFDAEGRLTFTHGAYPEAIRQLARRQGLRCVELEYATMRTIQQMGTENSKKLFCHVAPGHPHYPDGCADNSHLSERGAALIAGLFVDLLNGSLTIDSGAGQQGSAPSLSDLIDKEDDVLKHMEKTDFLH
ncbi:MAG: hypothetical protein IJ664_01725 [Clostridia bacterium]|nr:hypothetical protein [Clostridia bacterium]